MTGQMDGQMNGQMAGQMTGRMAGQRTGQMTGQMTSQLTAAARDSESGRTPSPPTLGRAISKSGDSSTSRSGPVRPAEAGRFDQQERARILTRIQESLGFLSNRQRQEKGMQHALWKGSDSNPVYLRNRCNKIKRTALHQFGLAHSA